MSRHNLYMFRCDKRLTQAEIADKIGVSRRGYANVENGKRGGTAEFWAAVQREFNVPDEEMYALMKLKEEQE